MNKFYKKYFNLGFLALFASLAMVSCADDETDFVANTKPIVTATATAFTVNEGDDVTVTLTSNVAYSQPFQIKLDVLSGNAIDQEDFTINGTPTTIDDGWGVDGYWVSFPANTTSFTFTISAILDEIYEDTENVRIRMSSTGTSYANINPNSEFIDITINNAASNSLNLTFAWDQNFEFGGDNYSLCDLEYDVDILVLDEDFNDLGVADAQTGDCPEHLAMSIHDYEDGTYYLVGYLYDNAGIAGVGIPQFDIPMRISYQRGGSQTLETEGTFSSPFMNSESANDDFDIVAIITIADGVFTIKRADDSTVAQGRQANVKNTIKNLKSRRANLKK